MEAPVTFAFKPTPESVAELDRLGDRIAELSAHLEVATGRLLILIREFDARQGWNTGFRSCAEWSHGARTWSSVPPGSECGWRDRSGRCPCSPRRSGEAMSPTPRFAL